jgi:hypothetical protein
MYYGESKEECIYAQMTEITSATFTLKFRKKGDKEEDEEDELTVFFDTELKSLQQAIPQFQNLANEAYDKLSMVT